MEEDPDKYRAEEAAGRQRRRTEERRKDPERYKLKEKTRKQNYRLSQMDTVFKRRKTFLAAVRNGSIFFCVCCHRKLYDNQEVELDKDWKESYETQYLGSYEKFIGPIPLRRIFLPCPAGEQNSEITSDYTCFTCKNYLEKNRMAPMSNQNNLQLANIEKHPELKLSELEQQLIALNLIFQKIVLLPNSESFSSGCFLVFTS